MKFALLSRNVITENARIPEHAVILVEGGVIQQVVSYKHADMDRVRREYDLKDFGSLYISPGLVDLNVSFNEESASTVTEQLPAEESLQLPAIRLLEDISIATLQNWRKCMIST